MQLNRKVRDILTPNPISAAPDATVESVARLMADTNCDVIPICKDGRTVGIVTGRDVACRTIARGLNPAQTKAGDIMTELPAKVFAD